MAFGKLKRHPVLLPATLLLFLFAVLCPSGTEASTPVRVTVNGHNLALDVPPMVRDGRTLLPMRAIFEALGAKVDWDPQARKIIGTRGTTVIVLHVGRTTATVGGRTVTLDSPPLVHNNRTLVPIRFVSENLGAQVNWDSAARLVTIRSGAAAPPVGGGGTAAAITLPDGSRYTGAVRNGVPHGYGTSTAPNGESYSGPWENGLRHGVGVITFPDRTSRTGLWNRGELAQWLSPDPHFR